jgi:hypothetical protein
MKSMVWSAATENCDDAQKGWRAVLAGVLLAGVIHQAVAQHGGTVYGTITDAATKDPLPLATALVRDTGFGAVADSNGFFEVGRIPPGTHVVEFRHVGYKTKFRVVNLGEGAAIEINIDLEQEPILLDEVTVTDTARIDRLLHQFPGSILITGSMLVETNARGVTEALQYLAPRFDVSSVRQRAQTRPQRGQRIPMQVRNILVMIDDLRIYPDAQEIYDSPYWLDKLIDINEIESMVIHRGDNAWIRAGRRGERLDWLVEIRRKKP